MGNRHRRAVLIRCWMPEAGDSPANNTPCQSTAANRPPPPLADSTRNHRRNPKSFPSFQCDSGNSAGAPRDSGLAET